MTNTEATRYLCAAANLNSKFRKKVIEQLIEPTRNSDCRAIAPSYGIDLVAVAGHAVAANRRKDRRNLLLFFCFFAGFVAMQVGIDKYIWLIACALFLVAGLIIYLEDRVGLSL